MSGLYGLIITESRELLKRGSGAPMLIRALEMGEDCIDYPETEAGKDFFRNLVYKPNSFAIPDRDLRSKQIFKSVKSLKAGEARKFLSDVSDILLRLNEMDMCEDSAILD